MSKNLKSDKLTKTKQMPNSNKKANRPSSSKKLHKESDFLNDCESLESVIKNEDSNAQESEEFNSGLIKKLPFDLGNLSFKYTVSKFYCYKFRKLKRSRNVGFESM